jgi:hypothetical protein
MQEEHADSTLSISQRAYAITKLLSDFGRILKLLLVVNLVFLSLAWLGFFRFAGPSQYGLALVAMFELFPVTAFLMVYYLVTGRRAGRHLDEWNKDYLQQAYILVFDTTVPRGNTTAEKILNLARAIFPELREFEYMNFLPPYLRLHVANAVFVIVIVIDRGATVADSTTMSARIVTCSLFTLYHLPALKSS